MQLYLWRRERSHQAVIWNGQKWTQGSIAKIRKPLYHTPPDSREHDAALSTMSYASGGDASSWYTRGYWWNIWEYSSHTSRNRKYSRMSNKNTISMTTEYNRFFIRTSTIWDNTENSGSLSKRYPNTLSQDIWPISQYDDDRFYVSRRPTKNCRRNTTCIHTPCKTMRSQRNVPFSPWTHRRITRKRKMGNNGDFHHEQTRSHGRMIQKNS